MASKYPLVCITWLDAHGSAVGTYSIDEIPHAAVIVKSYGLLLKQDSVGVSIASEQCDEDTWRGFTFIPAGMIVSVELVTKPRKKKKHEAPPLPTTIIDSPRTITSSNIKD